MIAVLKTLIYLISSSLFLPVLLILSGLSLWMLVYLGRFLRALLERRKVAVTRAKTGGDLPDQIVAQKIDGLFPGSVARVIRALAGFDTHRDHIRIVSLLQDEEHRMWKSLDSLKMIIRLGPGLGLIGTLIPMGTGLAALGQGDLNQLSQDLVVAFTTTVVGMALGLIAYCLFTVQRRWVEADVKSMELAAELLTDKDSNHKDNGHAVS